MTNPQGRVAVLDRAGWTKEYTLQKAIIHIGSDPRSDIVLEPGRGAGVAPRHAQLIAVPGSGEYRLVNLADGDIRLGPDNSQVLPPLSSMSLASGQQLTLGDFTLIFYGEQATPAETTVGSRNIGLKISLPQAQLAPNRTLQGLITVSNRGERTGAQFYLELEGLDPACCRIEPGPVLSSGAEKEVAFQLQHHGHQPLAGEYELVIRAAAPGAYPAEQASITHLIQVLPFYRHKMTLLGPDGAAMSPQEPPLPGVEPAVPAAPPQPAATWSAVEAPAEVEQQRVLKLKADQMPPVAQPVPAVPPEPEPEPAELPPKPAAADDWWAAETAARPASASASWWEPRPATARRVEEDRVLKLKTAPEPEPAAGPPPAPAPARDDTLNVPPAGQAEPVVQTPAPEVEVEPEAGRPEVAAAPAGQTVALEPEPPVVEAAVPAEPELPPVPPVPEPEPVPAGDNLSVVATVALEPEPPVEVEATVPAEPELPPEPEPRLAELEAPAPGPAGESFPAATAVASEPEPAGEIVTPEPEPPVEVEAAVPAEPELPPEPPPPLPALEPLPAPEAAPVEAAEWARPAEAKPDRPAESAPVEPAAADKPPEPAAPPAREERPRHETGDWWLGETAGQVGPDKTTETGVKPDLPRPALKLKAEETRPVEIEPPARAGRPRQGTEEWWIDAAPEEAIDSKPASRPRPVLKLKAAAPAEEEQPEENSSTAEDWWSPAGDST